MRTIIGGVFVWVLLSTLAPIQAQTNAQWRIADGIGIDFSFTGQVAYTACNMESELPDNMESVASVADEKGALLFYLDARMPPARPSRLFNASQTPIPNSEGIFAMSNVSNGALILPIPGAARRYYLFTLCPKNTEPLAPIVLYRHTIDMSTPIGMVTEKNIIVTEQPLCEKMAAVQHQNGKDWWLILHGYNNASFHRFLVSAKYITTHQIQDVGKVHFGFHGRQGEMTFSPDGKYLGLVTRNGIVELFHFDRCSGTISKHLYAGIPQPEKGVSSMTGEVYYGCSFSPNSKLFYYSTGHKLYQLPVETKENQFQTAKKVIWEDSLLLRHPITQHELAPDGKIYIAKYGTGYLSVISDPNQAGKACKFFPKGHLITGKKMKAGLPQFASVPKNDPKQPNINKDTLLCQGQKIEIGFTPESKYNYVWRPTVGLSANNLSKVKAEPLTTTTYSLTVLNKSMPSGCDTVRKLVYRITVVDSNQSPCNSHKIAKPVTEPQQHPTNPLVQPAVLKSVNSEPSNIPSKDTFSFALYPNPATDFVYLNYKYNKTKPVVLEIYDISGKRVFQRILAPNEEQLEINCQPFKEGNYLCNFICDGKTIATNTLVIRK